MKKKKIPFIFATHIGNFYALWFWKIAFTFIKDAKHDNPNKYFELWISEHAISFIFGSHGIGIGHSFGMEDGLND